MKNSENWYQPLHSSVNRRVYNPPIDFFLDKIKNNEYFTMIRFQDKFWGVINQGIISLGWKLNDVNVKNDEHLNSISQSWINFWKSKTSKILPYVFDKRIIYDNLKMICNQKPGNFYLSAEASADRPAAVINHFVPKEEILYFSTVWRMAAKHQTIEKLFEQNRNTRIVFIGPYYYKNFGKKLGLTDFTHFEMSHFEACKDIDKTLKFVNDNHNKWLGSNDKIIYLIVGGATGAWLATKMHGLDKAFILEMGRSLDIYYCYDKVRQTSPVWMWPTAWFQAIGHKHTDWVKKYKV